MQTSFPTPLQNPKQYRIRRASTRSTQGVGNRSREKKIFPAPSEIANRQVNKIFHDCSNLTRFGFRITRPNSRSAAINSAPCVVDPSDHNVKHMRRESCFEFVESRNLRMLVKSSEARFLHYTRPPVSTTACPIAKRQIGKKTESIARFLLA